MDEAIIRRCVTVAQHISKSSVHKAMCARLPKIDARLAREIAVLLEYNKAVRHLRGGEATRRRYQGLQSAAKKV